MADALVWGHLVEWADYAIIAAYFVVVLGVGIGASWWNRGSVSGYFLAGRSMNFIMVGLSLFASDQGSGHFIGLAGSGAATGIGVAGFELNAIFVLLFLGWIFVPVYIASGVYTLPEYLRLRFGGERIRVYLAVMALLLAVFTKISSDLYAGALFIRVSFGWSIYISIIALLLVAALFTITGGLTAVMWTDFIQTIIMLIGATYLTDKAFKEVGGGYRTVGEKYLASASMSTLECSYPELYRNATCTAKYPECGLPPANSLHLLRAAEDVNLPWPGMTFGLTIASVWYWCSDQVIVQRVLSAKDLSHAKAGSILAGWLKILPMWLMVLPGMISRILFPDVIGCVEPDLCEKACHSRSGCTNFAYPLLVIQLMPTGARGLMLAVMMSALMSSLTSIFNSCSTIFTVDIWSRIRKNPSETEQLIIGRLFVLVLVGIAIAWIPIVENFAELWRYVQSCTSYFAPPICAIYVLAVLWKRANEQGAFWGLMVGLVIGATRFIWESCYGQPVCGHPNSAPSIITKLHYLHISILLFVISSGVCIVVSLMTAPIEDKHLWRLTFWTRYSREERIDVDQERLEREKKKSESDGHVNPGFLGIPEDTDAQGGGNGPEAQQQNKRTFCGHLLSWICGVDRESQLTPEQRAQMQQQEKVQMSLIENPTAHKLCAINAVIVACVGIFLWGFFH